MGTITGKNGSETVSNNRTIYDVARDAGVSPATVSRVFSGKGYVSAETRSRVMSAAKGFSPRRAFPEAAENTAAKTIGIIVSPSCYHFFHNSTYADVMEGISKCLLARSYQMMLDVRNPSSDMLVDIYKQREVDGYILIGVDSTSTILRDLSEARIPMVLIGDCADQNDTGSCAHVEIDDFAAARDVTNFLITLGHKRIAFISCDYKYAASYNRFLGYKHAMEEAGLPFDPCFVVTLSDTSEDAAVNMTKHLLYQAEKPSAILAFNGVVSMAVYKAVADCGLRIPEDISVAGFDDNVFARHVSPAMTTVWQPSEEKGETAARILLEALDTGVLPSKVVTLPSMILYRSSCAPPAEA